MQNNQYNRFSAAPWFEGIQKSTVLLFGAGGVSSWLSLFLVRAGATIIVVDFDTVSDENLAGQLYGPKQVGKPKVTALKEVLESLNNTITYTALNQKVTDSEKDQWLQYLPICDLVITGFDNLPTRQIVYNQWNKKGKEDSLFLDMRMSMEQGNIFTVKQGNEKDKSAYESTFFPESEAVVEPCSAKATSHCGAFIAATTMSVITNWYTDKGDFRSVPQKINFFLPILNFEVL